MPILYPIGQGMATSFTRTKLLSTPPPRRVGLANYRRLVADARFWRALRVPLLYPGLAVSVTA